ncbi:preprotein translocase subunit TatC [Limnochorda pilosa]|uniref:Sec-independent protein translocase protein TatC n=1 Tax=Limnochorda pilosa TaxID=1555112 RepID=A0A0K2SQ76_LIMPI|nr:preprotein translocase subunit TatC [Limnochorda pilosa]
MPVSLSESSLPTMPLSGHLAELRRRLLVSGIVWIAASAMAWFLTPAVVSYLGERVGRLVFVTPAEAFVSLVKIAMTLGLVAAAPVILVEAWLFVLPGLFPTERRLVYRLAPVVVVLFVAGIVFSWFVMLPLMLSFFLGFQTERIHATITIARFLSFLMGVTLPFGLVFQLPLVTYTLTRIGVVPARFWARQRRYVVLMAFIVGALLTPPDPVSQALLAIPLLFLYEIGAWVARRAERLRVGRGEEGVWP